MPAFEVTGADIEKAKRALDQYPRTAEPILQKAVIASVAEFQKAATRGIVPWKTGNLVQSFGTGIVLGRLIGKITPTAKYAVMVHEGTRPHVITPKDKKALFWKGAAHPMKSVKHPGTKPNKFMPKILERARGNIVRHFEDAMEKIANQLTK